MHIDSRKINIIKAVVETQDETLLSKMEEIISRHTSKDITNTHDPLKDSEVIRKATEDDPVLE